MRTEDDVRHALSAPPDPDALDRLHRFATELDDAPTTTTAGRSRGRLTPLLAAAAAVVVVAGGAAAVAGLASHHDRTAHPPVQHQHQHLTPASPLRPTWNLRIDAVSGYRFSRVMATGGGTSNSSVLVSSTDPSRPERGLITTCAPVSSLSDCATAEPGHPLHDVTVDGRPGLFEAGRALPDGSPHTWRAAQRDGQGPTIAWFVGERTVAFLQFTTIGFRPSTGRYDNSKARQDLIRIAGAVTAGHRDPAYLPFRLRNLPAHVVPESVLYGEGGACADYGDGPKSRTNPLDIYFTACRVRTGATRAATLAAANAIGVAETGNSGEITTGTAFAAVFDYPNGTSMVVAVATGKKQAVTHLRAERIAAGGDVSPTLDDRSSWFEVR